MSSTTDGTRVTALPRRSRIGVGAAASCVVGLALGLAASVAPEPALAGVLVVGVGAVALCGRHGLVTIGVLFLAVVPFVTGQIVGHPSNPAPAPLRAFDDVAVLLGWALLALHWRRIPAEIAPVALTGALLLGMSELCGLATHLSDPRLRAGAAWQDLRWLGLLGWGLALAARLDAQRIGRVVLGLLGLWCLSTSMLSVGQFVTGHTGEVRAGIPRTEGAFGHPTPASLAGTGLLIFALSQWTAREGHALVSKRALRGAFVLGLMTVIVSTRYKPLLGLAAAALLVATLYLTRSAVLAAALPVVLVVGVSFAIAVTGDIQLTAAPATQSNVAAAAAANAPTRFALLRGANRLAREHVPWGGGLGTFGSDLDPGREQLSFDDAGLGATWGFDLEKSDFRQDSNVAHVLAERGYFGLLFWALGLAVITLALLRWSPTSLYPAAAVTAMMATTPISPAFHSILYSLLLIAPAFIALAAVQGQDVTTCRSTTAGTTT